MFDVVDVDVLWGRCKGGDRSARDELILRYEPLVQHVAARMAGNLPRSVEQADLVSYGVFGLVDAIEKFDPGRGIKFETYAISRIRGAVLDGLRAADWVPRSVRAKARAVEAAHSQLEAELHREPADGEMADALDLTLNQFQVTLGQVSFAGPVALDEILAAGGDRGESLVAGVAAGDVADDVVVADVQELQRMLAETVSVMPGRESMVFILYYCEGLTLAEIGQVLGVTESRVCQIHTKVISCFHERLTSG